jgi:hypothetical protein
MASCRHPRVNDDNPFSEASFRTCKDRPHCPTKAFVAKDDAQAWVKSFASWYHSEHLHGAIRFFTPGMRNAGLSPKMLERLVLRREPTVLTLKGLWGAPICHGPISPGGCSTKWLTPVLCHFPSREMLILSTCPTLKLLRISSRTGELSRPDSVGSPIQPEARSLQK